MLSPSHVSRTLGWCGHHPEELTLLGACTITACAHCYAWQDESEATVLNCTRSSFARLSRDVPGAGGW